MSSMWTELRPIVYESSTADGFTVTFAHNYVLLGNIDSGNSNNKNDSNNNITTVTTKMTTAATTGTT